MGDGAEDMEDQFAGGRGGGMSEADIIAVGSEVHLP